MDRVRGIAVLLGTVALTACSTPFSQRIVSDRAVADARGTITLSVAKPTSREALIDERAHDVAWYDRLISDSEDSTKVTFQPELMRELEQISTFAIAIGAKFDPAAALSYRQRVATGEVQSQIDLLKLQLQLDQLRRDAELVRGGFAAQTAPANAGVGTLVASSGAANPSNSVSSADQLTAAIDKLQAALVGRLDADGKPAAKTTVPSSPFDDFNDRSSLRDIYKSARNAAVLDEAHDAGNARLMHLNFQATVMPVERYLHSLGVLQLRIIPPDSASPTATFLGNWLHQLNADPRFRTPDGKIARDDVVSALLASGHFEQVRLGVIDLVLPSITEEDGAETPARNLLIRAQWDGDDAADQALFQSALSALSTIRSGQASELLQAVCAGTKGPQGHEAVERALYLSHDRAMTQDWLRLADEVAGRFKLASNLVSTAL